MSAAIVHGQGRPRTVSADRLLHGDAQCSRLTSYALVDLWRARSGIDKSFRPLKIFLAPPAHRPGTAGGLGPVHHS